MSDTVLIDPFNNVAATGLAVTKYRPPSLASSLFGIVLQLGGGAFNESHVTSVRVRAPGGKDLIPQISGARMRTLWEYQGGTWPTARDFLPIMFGDPFAKTEQGSKLGNFDHSIYQGDLTIEVQITGATTPTLEAYALVDPNKAALNLQYAEPELFLHRALIETVLTPSAAVSKQAQQIGIGSSAGALLKRVNFFHSNMTRLQVKKNGLVVFEDIPAGLNDFMQADMFARVTQSGLFAYDRIQGGAYRDVGSTVDRNGRVENWQFELTTSAADTINVYSDVLINLPPL